MDVNNKMRIYHRYLGYFLAGIMMVYGFSGIVLIFRDTNVFKKETLIEKELPGDIKEEELGRALRIRDLKVEKTDGNIVYFEQGTFNRETGKASYKTMELPFVLEKLTQLHKASTSKPLYYFNIFFGVSLVFFALSAFWMFLPKTEVFKKGIYFALVGLVLALILLFI